MINESNKLKKHELPRKFIKQINKQRSESDCLRNELFYKDESGSFECPLEGLEDGIESFGEAASETMESTEGMLEENINRRRSTISNKLERALTDIRFYIMKKGVFTDGWEEKRDGLVVEPLNNQEFESVSDRVKSAIALIISDGEAFWQILRNGSGRPEVLTNLCPKTIAYDIGEHGIEQYTFEPRDVYNMDGFIELHSEDVVHFSTTDKVSDPLPLKELYPQKSIDELVELALNIIKEELGYSLSDAITADFVVKTEVI